MTPRRKARGMAIAQASDFGNRTADTHECGRLYWSAECVCGFHGSARTRAALIALILDHEGWRLRQRREPGFVAYRLARRASPSGDEMRTIMTTPTFDADGYPTERDASAALETRPDQDVAGALDFLAAAWHWPDFAQRSLILPARTRRRCCTRRPASGISGWRPAGGAGNESLIAAPSTPIA